MDHKGCCSSEDNSRKRNIQKIKTQSVKINISTNSGSCCCGETCGEQQITQYNMKDQWIIGEIKTDVGMIPQISTKLSASDILGAWKVRWGIGRMNYKINPGLYAIGNPDENSNVLVTANYKLTLDMLRKELSGLNLWILVLDTHGVNVWCAAGKGTFGTKELINRITRSKLSEIVSHKTIILPQLGAPGIVSYEVTKKTGFQIKYGPVRASDINAYISGGLKVDAGMREVKFTIKDRLILTPMEITSSLKPSILIFGIMFLINLIAVNKFGVIDFYGYIGALMIGCFLTPVLLPWTPVRPFALKGWILGLLWSVFVVLINGWPVSGSIELLRGLAYLLILPSTSAYFAMNFTGSSTYTSHSGVLKEMKTAIPLIVITISLGTALLLINSFIKL